jgi:hypothetical protein
LTDSATPFRYTNEALAKKKEPTYTYDALPEPPKEEPK